MSRWRILIDIEFDVDEEQFKSARLSEDATGVSDITDAGVREAVSDRLIRADWADQGLNPQRSTVRSRDEDGHGVYVEIMLPADVGVTSTGEREH